MYHQNPALVHALPPAGSAPTATRLADAEDLAWAHLYRAVRQPPAAAEVVNYLERDLEALQRHMALYLIAKETLHSRALAEARSEQTVAAIRAVVSFVLTSPARLLRWCRTILTGVSADISRDSEGKAMAKSKASRARARVAALGREPDLASAIAGFPAPGTAAATTAAASADPGESRSSKAA